MKYELGIRVDIRARLGHHAVMHLRNCEPRGKENAKNISLSHRTSALADFINEMLRDIVPPGRGGNFRN